MAARIDGTRVELGRPPWSEGVADWRVAETHALDGKIAAHVQPLKAGPRGMVLDRAQRAGWAFFAAIDGAFDGWGDRAWTSLCPLGADEILVCRYFEHRVQRLAWPDLVLLDELTFPLSQCGIERLVLSPTQRLGLAYLNSGQGDSGYELFETRPLRQLEGGPGFQLPVMGRAPLFSPDERKVYAAVGASAHDPYNHLWWIRREPGQDHDEATPSPGGAFPFAIVLSHDIETRQIHRHAIDVLLPKGWLPTDLESLAWTIPELAFVGSDYLELSLPNGGRSRLPLPLEEHMTIDGLE